MSDVIRRTANRVIRGAAEADVQVIGVAPFMSNDSACTPAAKGRFVNVRRCTVLDRVHGERGNHATVGEYVLHHLILDPVPVQMPLSLNIQL
jgi:hypothetical protein